MINFVRLGQTALLVVDMNPKLPRPAQSSVMDGRIARVRNQMPCAVVLTESTLGYDKVSLGLHVREIQSGLGSVVFDLDAEVADEVYTKSKGAASASGVADCKRGFRTARVN